MEDTVSKSTEANDLSVEELNRKVSSLLETAFPYPVWVRGEIAGNPRPGRRGHAYFQLVEPSEDGGFPRASVDCALFAGSRASIVRQFARIGEPFDLKEGMSIRVLGRVNLWPKAGRYQLVISAIDAAWSQGTQALRLKRLAEKLRREGVLGLNGRLSLPRLPLRVGLVTSKDSAASRDFLQTLAESRYPFQVFAAWAWMQGERTGSSVSSSLRRLASIDDLDAVVLTRGGGSTTDLGWLNDEEIARAIAHSPHPVVSGIGHEIDTTLPDLTASVRAKTPTQAAAILVDSVAGFEADLDSLGRMLERSALPALRSEASRLRSAASSLARAVHLRCGGASAAVDRQLAALIRDTKRLAQGSYRLVDRRLERLGDANLSKRLRNRRSQLEEVRKALGNGVRALLASHGLRLEKLAGLAESRDPERALALGWAIARHADGRLVESVGELSPGDVIDVRLRDGSLSARTEDIRPD